MTYTDIVYPENNETDFLDIASILGFTKLIFTYNLKSTTKPEIKKQLTIINKIKSKTIEEIENKNLKLSIECAILIDSEKFKKLNNNTLKEIKNTGENLNHIIFDASSENDLRSIAKNKFIDLIIRPELNKNNDFMHQRNGGLDSVICKNAADFDTKIGFSLNDITDIRNKRMIGRAAQNMLISKKYKSGIIIASFAKKPSEMKAPKDIISLIYLIQLDKKTSRMGMKGFNQKSLYTL